MRNHSSRTTAGFTALLVPALMLAAAGVSLAQDLQEGEILLLGKITAVDVGRSQFTMKAERFVVSENRENAITPPKTKTVSMTAQTALSLKDNAQKKLSLKDLRAGMNVAATGKDSGQGKPLPARVVVVWEDSDSGVRNVPAAPAPGGGQTTKPERAENGIEGVLQAMKEGRWEAALTMLTPILIADWKDQKAWRLAAKLLAQAKRGGEDRLGASFKAALLPATETAAAKRYQMLRVLAQSGFAELALSEYETMLQEDRMDAAAYTGQAAAYLEQYELVKAEGSAEVAMKVNGNYLPGYVIKAKAQLERRNAEGAAETLRAALQKDSNNADAHGLMAQALLLMPTGPLRQEGAAAEIQRALQLDPENAEGLFAQAILHEQRGEKQEAQKAWDRYLEVDPTSRRAQNVANGLVVVRQTIISQKSGETVGWTPDGKFVVLSPYAGDLSSLVFIAADGSGQERLVKTPGPSARGGASVSPDGTKLVCTTHDPNGDLYRCYWQPLDDPGQAVLIAAGDPGGGHFPFNPCWSPDGRQILYNDTSDFDHAARFVSLDETGRPRPGATRLPESFGEHQCARWTQEPGRLVYGVTRPDGTQLLLSHPQGDPPTLLWRLSGDYRMGFPDLSPDLTKVVFGLGRGRDLKTGGGFAACVAAADGAPEWVAIGPPLNVYFCRAFWSPEGDRILCDGPGWKPLVSALGGKRKVLEMQVSSEAMDHAVEGPRSDVPLVVSLRNLTPQPQAVVVEAQLGGGTRAMEAAPVKLTIPPRETVKRTLTVSPGARGTYHAMVTAKGEDFQLGRSVSLKVTEGWGDRMPVAVLPFTSVDKASREDQAVGFVVADALDHTLSRLWQLNVLPQGPVLRRLGQQPYGDFFACGGWQSMQGPKVLVLLDPAETAGKPVPADLGAVDPEHVKARCATFKHSKYLVGGTFTHAGEDLQVEAVLVDVVAGALRNDTKVTVKGKLQQLPNLLSQLSQGVVSKMGITLEGDQRDLLQPHVTTNAEALRSYGEAWMLAVEGDSQKAVEQLQKSLTADPTSSVAHNALGLYHLSRGKADEALAEFQIALSFDAEDLRTREGLVSASLWGWPRDQLQKEAVALLDCSPLHPYAQYALAMLCTEKGQRQEAVDRCQRALRDPYLKEDLGEGINQVLAALYAEDLSLDPNLRVEVEVAFQQKPLKEVLQALSKVAGVTLVAAVAQDQPMTLNLGKVKVGAAMNEIVKRVAGKWSRTDQGYFLVAK